MNNHESRFAMGDTGKEKLTGITGRVIAINFWETGCTQIGIKQLGVDKDGKPFDVLWFDEMNVDQVGADPEKAPHPSAKPGGPLTAGKTHPTR